MPMPHQTFSQLIRRRLVGKEGKARLKVLQEALQELPNYKNGPYADLRKWVNEEIDRTRVRAKTGSREGEEVIFPTTILKDGDMLTIPDLFPGWELPITSLWPPVYE